MFLPRESSISSTTRISKMNPSAARRAKRSGRDRQVPAHSGRKQRPFVHSAGGKPLFPSSLPRAVRFIAVSASSAGRRNRPRQPGNSLFPKRLLGWAIMSTHAVLVLSFLRSSQLSAPWVAFYLRLIMARPSMLRDDFLEARGVCAGALVQGRTIASSRAP